MQKNTRAVVLAAGGLVGVIAFFLPWVMQDDAVVGGYGQYMVYGDSQSGAQAVQGADGLGYLIFIGMMIAAVISGAYYYFKPSGTVHMAQRFLPILGALDAFWTTFHSTKDAGQEPAAAGTAPGYAVSLSFGFWLAVVAVLVIGVAAFWPQPGGSESGSDAA